MGWEDLITEHPFVAPWTGGRKLAFGNRLFAISVLPDEHGWYSWQPKGRTATPSLATVEADFGGLRETYTGYLVGDRFVRDNSSAHELDLTMSGIARLERVFLIEDGLDRFTRVSVGRFAKTESPLIFRTQEFPLGPEDAVRGAYEDQKTDLAGIKSVTPALEASFRLAVFQRAETERRRVELERRRAEEIRRQELQRLIGDGAGRRALAQTDFAAGARAALNIAGAIYLDHKKGVRPNEMVVTFRFLNRRFRCSCDQTTLSIIDAGICLTDHHTDERGDSYFTLESLPIVILQAEREHKLVVYNNLG